MQALGVARQQPQLALLPVAPHREGLTGLHARQRADQSFLHRLFFQQLSHQPLLVHFPRGHVPERPPCTLRDLFGPLLDCRRELLHEPLEVLKPHPMASHSSIHPLHIADGTPPAAKQNAIKS